MNGAQLLDFSLGFGLAWPAAIAALLLALGWDWWHGEPPAAVHPVVWMGKALHRLGQRIAPRCEAREGLPNPWRTFWLGAAAWWLLALLVVGTAAVLQAALVSMPRLLPGTDGVTALLWQSAGLALLLKPMMAWRMLHDEVLAVQISLQQSLTAGRTQLARLVSRDVHALDEPQVCEAAMETLAENLNDSVVAPLFWFVLLGLPGAALYRMANTADAMWGYTGERGGRDWLWAGKWAARTDDVLSWVPARLTAVLLLAAHARISTHWRSLRTEARHTPSPNGGWPMAAMALLLGLRLAKPVVYTLNATGKLPAPADIARACQAGQRAVWLLAAIAGAALAVTAMAAVAGGLGWW